MQDQTWNQQQRAHEECECVFVYGTLREGQGNNYRITSDPGCKKIGTGETVRDDRFKMYGASACFPYVTVESDDGTGTIVGDVYEVTLGAFASCDRLEGYPHHYTREIVEVCIGEGRIVKAWMYVVHDTELLRTVRMDHVPSGDWVEARTEYIEQEQQAMQEMVQPIAFEDDEEEEYEIADDEFDDDDFDDEDDFEFDDDGRGDWDDSANEFNYESLNKKGGE